MQLCEKRGINLALIPAITALSLQNHGLSDNVAGLRRIVDPRKTAKTIDDIVSSLFSKFESRLHLLHRLGRAFVRRSSTEDVS